MAFDAIYFPSMSIFYLFVEKQVWKCYNQTNICSARGFRNDMSENYQPPFTMNEEITNLIVEIGEYVGRITTYDAMRPNPILRRENCIKKEAGVFRSGNVGVYAGTELIHAGTPASSVCGW